MMNDTAHKTRLFARNTLMLYFRMFFLMILGLFTSRIVLESLGENDYGIYNVVGGVVAMFTVISGALATAVTRFITFEMGKGTSAELNKVYSTAVNVQIILAVIIVLIAEPVGLWFIDNKMTIDPSRIPAARVVMQFSLLSFVINLMSVPQMASITAHEKMSAYAVIGILDGCLRFAAALLLSRSGSDRLVMYAALMCASVIAVRVAYGIYCRLHFPECRYRIIFDKSLVKDMFSFAGWSFIGSSSGVLRDQGGNLLINLFFDPAVNAARGVAVQLNNAIQSFITNFMTAVNPQITKSYASGDHVYMFSLIRKASRMSFYLLFILALPVLFNAEMVMSIWLKEVPEHSALFVQLFLIFTLSESISQPLITSMFATGNIRNYQIVVGGLQLMNLPVSYICLRYGASPESTIVVAIVISQICLAARLYMLKNLTGLSVRDFLTRVYLNVLSVAAAAVLLPFVISGILPEGVTGFMISVTLSVLSACLSVLFVGCTSEERREMLGFVKNRLTGKCYEE